MLIETDLRGGLGGPIFKPVTNAIAAFILLTQLPESMN